MAADLEKSAQTGAPVPTTTAPDTASSSGRTSPDPEKELTEEEVQAIRARYIAEQEQKRAEEEQELKRKRGPTVPLASLFKKKDDETLDQVATQPSVYDDKNLARFFQPHPKYENLHRFDPSERWTWREEYPIINRIDWRITTWACIAFFGLDLGRGNLQQANTDNFLEDLGMNTNDYNLGNTVVSPCSPPPQPSRVVQYSNLLIKLLCLVPTVLPRR